MFCTMITLPLARMQVRALLFGLFLLYFLGPGKREPLVFRKRAYTCLLQRLPVAKIPVHTLMHTDAKP